MGTPRLSPSATPLGLQRGAPKTGGKLHRGLVPGEGARGGGQGRVGGAVAVPGAAPRDPCLNLPLPTGAAAVCPGFLQLVGVPRQRAARRRLLLVGARTEGRGRAGEGDGSHSRLRGRVGGCTRDPRRPKFPPGGCVESCREQGAFQESFPPWHPRGPSRRRCRYVRRVQQETLVYHSPAPPQLPTGSCCHHGACLGVPRTLPRCVQPAASPCQG